MDLQIAEADLRAKAASLDKVYDDLQGKEGSETFEEIETRTVAETNKDKAVFSQIKAQKNLADLLPMLPPLLSVPMFPLQKSRLKSSTRKPFILK